MRTLYALGPLNLLRVGLYHLGLKTRLHPVLKIRSDCPKGPFFRAPCTALPKDAVARCSWQKNHALYFGIQRDSTLEPPDWHANPFQPDARTSVEKCWWQIPDFDPETGDIKSIWEASRFDWLLAMSERVALGERTELTRLNHWLQDWTWQNPPYLGANWKCGQEASIRVIHLALTARILGQVSQPEPGLLALIRMHLTRIAPTIKYAIGQANNHGTSEAAALFTGGSWLAAAGDSQGQRWQAMGRRWMENRASILIAADGTFSQYSVNYHRVMLDTFSFAECWRQALALPGFSQQFSDRLSAATDWLEQMTDSKTGDTPNIGANDGAQIISLTDTGYRDFRPSVQLASVLFRRSAAYHANGSWDQPLIWLGLEKPKTIAPTLQSITLNDGGLHILRCGQAVAYLRYPRFRFRPSQADALHCDLWVGGQNIARDAGTFSYNSTNEDLAYFNGTGAHNTIEFDGRDQMPRLGRFLFGPWLKTQKVQFVADEHGHVTAAAAYRDGTGAWHHRKLRLEAERLVCVDEISGFSKRAILRWRLMPGIWQFDGNVLINGRWRLQVTSDVSPLLISLTQGEESRYYLQKTSLPVLEAEINCPSTLTTQIHF